MRLKLKEKNVLYKISNQVILFSKTSDSKFPVAYPNALLTLAVLSRESESHVKLELDTILVF